MRARKHRAEKCDEENEKGEWIHTWDVVDPEGVCVAQQIRTRREAREEAKRFDKDIRTARTILSLNQRHKERYKETT